jgi:hypothetical protein
MGLAPRTWESRMTIGEIVRQGFYYARTCRSLWLFGFFVGASGGSSGGGRSGGAGDGSGIGFLNLSMREIAVLAIIILLMVAMAFVMRFIAEGALIEGVVRARQGGKMTIREGFRTGWAHWGVLVRIALLYFAATAVSVILLVAPCVIALYTLGPLGGVLLGIPAACIAVPWLVTLYLVQAFAWRIAVLENRHALDAIDKARLFLHGRLTHGLKLIVATLVGTLAIVLLGIVALVPVGFLLAVLASVLGILPVVALGFLVVAPAMAVLAAVVGTFRSSIWTIGYVSQVES